MYETDLGKLVSSIDKNNKLFENKFGELNIIKR
jgi:hypothetical protein